MKNFRFIRRNNEFSWRHPADTMAGDIDCTNMTDDAFEAEVCRAVGIFAFCRVL